MVFINNKKPFNSNGIYKKLVCICFSILNTIIKDMSNNSLVCWLQNNNLQL